MKVPPAPQPIPDETTARHAGRFFPTFGAVRTLRLLLAVTILLPLLLGAAGAFLSYQASSHRAAMALAEAAAVAEENTTKVLDTHLLVAARISDMLAGQSESDIRAHEQTLHDRIAAQIKALPEVAAAWVLGPDGHELVSARVYPVNPSLDHSDREDFRAMRDGHSDEFIWALRARSLDGGDYQAFFTVSRRLEAPDGSFGGIVVVAVSGGYFGSFYDSLLGGSAQYTASVLRDDGTVLARYPAAAPSAPPGASDTLLAKAIAAREAGGIIANGSPLHGSVVAYKRLADYPIYVAIGRTSASILHEWLASVAGYAAIVVAAGLALVLLSLIALRRTGREQAALAQARDAVAQRAAMEAQLQQAQKIEAVGLLTAGIAHDFNNLLTVVSGNIALLQKDIEGADQRHDRLVNAAVSACGRAAALTKRLLSFARSEPTDPQPVDVNEAITGVAELPWRAPGDQIATEFRVSGDLWPVFVDPHQLESAILNLALNARDAMQGHGTLTIETGNRRVADGDALAHPGLTAGDYVAVTIGDTGCGMPPEVRDRAFDPFFTTKESGKGTGLGLAQVYGFVTRFGGHCAIDSEAGRGTTINLLLPRYNEAAREAGDRGDGAADTAAAPRTTPARPEPVVRAK